MKFFTTALLATATTAVTLNTEAGDYKAPAIEHQHAKFEEQTTYDRQYRKHYTQRPVRSFRTETQVGYKTEVEDHSETIPTTTYGTQFQQYAEDVGRDVTEIDYITRERLVPRTVQDVVTDTKTRTVGDFTDEEVEKSRTAVEHKSRNVDKTVYETKYKTLQRKVPKTVYDTKTRQVPRTVYDTVTETLQRDVPVTKTRKVAKQSFEVKRETLYRTEYETKYENKQELRFRDEPETRTRSKQVKKFRPKTTTKTRQVESTITEPKVRQVASTYYENNPDVHYFNVPREGVQSTKNGVSEKYFNEDGVPYYRTKWIKEDKPITTHIPHGIARDNLTARTRYMDQHYDEEKTVLIDEEYEVAGLEVYYETETEEYTVENKVPYTVDVRVPYKVATQVPYEKVSRVPVTKYVDEEYETTEVEDYDVSYQVARTVYDDEEYQVPRVIYVDEDYEQAYTAPKTIQVKEHYTEEKQVPYTVLRKVPTTREEEYEVDRIVNRTEYDTLRYQIPRIKEDTVYDTFHYGTSTQVPTTTEQTYNWQVGKRVPVYRSRRVPTYTVEEQEHTTYRDLPRTELVKTLENHSHTLDRETSHDH